MSVSLTSWPTDYDLIHLASVDSTNAEAMRRVATLTGFANGLATGPAWILADEQTAARGRRGRAWLSGTDNLAATLVMQPTGGPTDAALRSFVAALALFDAVVAVTGSPRGLSLKWPNDVLLNGAKMAGILLESLSDPRTGTQHLAIGIGVNLANAPRPDMVEAGAVPPVDLASHGGVAVTPRAFLTPLAAAFAGYEAQLTTYGFAPIRTAWLDRAARLGEVITARTGTASTTGTFQTIDDTGALVLATAKGRVVIPAADIYFEGAGHASGD
ncbi:MAG: biotin--[acetyl-CoA-carboxylase] ligase [Paracoccaceae bacterium]